MLCNAQSPVAAGILYIYIYTYTYNSLYITSLCIYAYYIYIYYIILYYILYIYYIIYGCMKWFNEHGPTESTDIVPALSAGLRFLEGGGVFANLHMADAWHVILYQLW